MGLFGGFKAKFSKDSTAKSSKSVKKDEVVCLGYRVYSEFDSPTQYAQSTPETRRPPPAIRTVAPRPKSATNSDEFNSKQPSTPVETQIITNPKIKKSSKKRAPETEKHISAVNLTPDSNIIEENSSGENRQSTSNISNPDVTFVTTERVILRNGGMKESRSTPNSIYIAGQTSSFNPNARELSISSNNINNTTNIAVQEVSPRPPKSILKSKSIYTEEAPSENFQTTKDSDNNNLILTTDENIHSDAEYDRTLTMASSKINKSNKLRGYATETVDYMSATQSINETNSTSVATYVRTEVSSNSKDTTASSYYAGGYNYGQNTRSIGNTSNHAANIFFGGDEEPEVQRPRKANLAVLQNEEDGRSSAEC